MALSEIKNKLRAYSLTAGAVVGGLTAANAKIIYTNIDPDSTLSGNGNMYQLDLNNDNVVDFDIVIRSLSIYYFVTQRIDINAKSINSVNASMSMVNTGYGSRSFKAALANKPGLKVDWNASWLYGTGIALAKKYSGFQSLTVGKWWGVDDRYLGVKFKITGQTYYGWARLSVDSTGKNFTIKDYAYNTKAQEVILTGDTGVVTSAPVYSLNEQVSIYGFEDKIFLNLNEDVNLNGEVYVTDMNGRKVFSSKIVKAHSTITLVKPRTGIYVVKLSIGDAIVTRNIFLKRSK